MIEKFYSDYGKLCTCGDTIHSYEIGAASRAFRLERQGQNILLHLPS